MNDSESTGKAIGIILGVLIVPFLLALLVMWLWNWIVPNIFGLMEITYWQSWGLVILSNILFKSTNYNFKIKD